MAGRSYPGDTVYSAVDAKPNRSTSLRRLANIPANPRVGFSDVLKSDGDGQALWWVRADGPALLLAAEEPEGRYAIMRLVVRYPQYREQPPHGLVGAIDVTRWSSWSADSD